MNLTDCKELSLKNVKISGDIIGKLGMFEIEQTFVNDSKKALEVGYTFPIAETATIIDFEAAIGDKVLKGQCKETFKAKKEYAKNIVRGNSAYLMEEKSDNIFVITIGKLIKDEEVKIKINYIDKFEIVDNQIQVFIPTLVPPKYNSKITDNLKYGKVAYKVDFSINITSTVNFTDIQSPTHKFSLKETTKGKKLEVLNYDMSKDFKLYFDLANELTSNALTSKTRDGKNILYMSFMPEITDSYEDSEKEYLFLVDVSGSMYGEKLEETKRAVIECLKQLDSGDKFNIIPFESEFEAMSINSLEYNEKNLKNAIKYVKSLTDKGGTEILDPIKFALYEKDSDKVVLLFTDGEVGNEEEIITYVENNIGESRLFPFGIDYNVNSYFLRDLAKVGNGKAEIIMPQEKIDDKIIRTFARIQTPLLENLKIQYGKNNIIDEIREDNVLFNYEFYNVIAKTKNINNDIILSGKILDKKYSWIINKDNITETDIDLETIFAKMEIDRLEDYIRNCNDDDKIQEYKDMIVELSEKYNINSKYTSFITIYEREDKILESPIYQETILSDEVFEYSAPSSHCVWQIDRIFDLEDNACLFDNAMCSISKRRGLNKQNSTEISNENLITKKINEYYDNFINKTDKSIVTYLLLALYYWLNDSVVFDYVALIKYIEKDKNSIINNIEIQKLLYLLYQKLINEDIEDFGRLEELLHCDTKKALFTNLKYRVQRKKIDESKILENIKTNNFDKNIDLILWGAILHDV